MPRSAREAVPGCPLSEDTPPERTIHKHESQGNKYRETRTPQQEGGRQSPVASRALARAPVIRSPQKSPPPLPRMPPFRPPHAQLGAYPTKSLKLRSTSTAPEGKTELAVESLGSLAGLSGVLECSGGHGTGGSGRTDSLWVLLVDRAVHPNGGAQPLLALVLLDAPQHGRQGGRTQAG